MHSNTRIRQFKTASHNILLPAINGSIGMGQRGNYSRGRDVLEPDCLTPPYQRWISLADLICRR